MMILLLLLLLLLMADNISRTVDDDTVGQQGPAWTRTAKDKGLWRTLAEDYIPQWQDSQEVRNESNVTSCTSYQSTVLCVRADILEVLTIIERVGNRIRQAIGPYEDLLTTVKKRKLRWYGHKTRSTGLAKMILQGTVQGGRRRGRQKKRWEDNVTEWTGLKLGEALRRMENSGCPIILGAPMVN